MPLNFIDGPFSGLEGWHFRATDVRTGKDVAVRISHEAEQDFGFPEAQDVASRKFDAGQLEDDGGVFVRTVDFGERT